MRMLIICIAFLLVSCGVRAPSMSSVMESCETRSDFSSYVSCIKNDYTRDPGHQTVRSLYAQLSAINEDYQSGALSNTKARAAAYKAYDQTVGAGNARQRANAAAYNPPTIINNTYNSPSSSTSSGNYYRCTLF